VIGAGPLLKRFFAVEKQQLDGQGARLGLEDAPQLEERGGT